jgi:hypothetical protein
MMRYFIGFMVTLGLIILLIILLFRGGGKPSTTGAGKPLISYANTTAEAQLTIDGPVNAQQEHQQIKVSVSRDTVTFEQLQGYDGSVVNLQTFANTENAYDVFLHALTVANFTKGNPSSALRDERGYCALGDRYIFEFTQNSNDLERYWATSCGSPKSYLGSLNLTIDLFQKQVPNYSLLTQNVVL